jgi:hypothetical protein
MYDALAHRAIAREIGLVVRRNGIGGDALGDVSGSSTTPTTRRKPVLDHGTFLAPGNPEDRSQVGSSSCEPNTLLGIDWSS